MSTPGAQISQGAPMTGGVPLGAEQSFFERYKYWLIVGGVALAAIVLIKVVGRLRAAEDAEKPADEWGHVEAPMRPHGLEYQESRAHDEQATGSGYAGASGGGGAGYQHIGGAMPAAPVSHQASVQPHVMQPQIPQYPPQAMMPPPQAQPPPLQGGGQMQQQLPMPAMQSMQPQPPMQQMPMQQPPMGQYATQQPPMQQPSGFGSQGGAPQYQPPNIPPAPAGAAPMMMGAGSGDVPFSGDLPSQSGGGGGGAAGGYGAPPSMGQQPSMPQPNMPTGYTPLN